jgi:hypothetical protein
MAKKRQRCFVIMPFGDTTKDHTETYWTNHFKDFLKPLIEENPELEVYRSKPLRGDILREIITHLVVSPVVVADLTDSNPNVYWELGIRQSFKHGTVTIAEAGPPLPFDVSVKGTLFYHPGDHIETAKFSRDFKEAIEDCLENPDKPDSHVLETISGRGTLFEIFRRDEAMRRLNALLDECKFNQAFLKECVKGAQANQKKPKERTWPTSRFLGAAVELLVTQRYVDETDSFFGAASHWMTWVLALNGEISEWPQRSDTVESWLLQHNEKAAKVLEGVQTNVIAARDRLAKRF